MALTRRGFVAGAGGVALGAACAPAALGRIALGAGQVLTLSDGALTLPGDVIFAPMPQDDLGEVLAQHQVARDVLRPECNLTLYRSGGVNVLFDVGSGPDFMPTAGRITDSLDAVGLAPEDITHVVFTHAHPDHIWGLLDEFDDPLFYEAEYLMGRAEWDFWWDPDTVDRVGDARAAFAVGARRRMGAIEDAVTLFDGGDEILPGIAAIASHGHTPGHMSFEIREGSESVLVLGDAIGNHHVAFARPAWHSGSDQDAAQAAAARQALLDRAAHEQARVVGFHLPGGGMGRVERAAPGFRFVEEA